MKKTLALVTGSLVFLLVGCSTVDAPTTPNESVKAPQEPVMENDVTEEAVIAQSETTENIELKNYETPEYSFNYDGTLTLNDKPEDSPVGFVSLVDSSTGKETVKIGVQLTTVDAQIGDWKAIYDGDKGTIGTVVSSDPTYLIGDKTVYRKIFEGNGFQNEFEALHRMVEVGFPNINEDKFVDIWVLAPKDLSEEYEAKLLEIISSFEWK